MGLICIALAFQIVHTNVADGRTEGIFDALGGFVIGAFFIAEYKVETRSILKRNERLPKHAYVSAVRKFLPCNVAELVPRLRLPQLFLFLDISSR